LNKFRKSVSRCNTVHRVAQ